MKKDRPPDRRLTLSLFELIRVQTKPVHILFRLRAVSTFLKVGGVPRDFSFACLTWLTDKNKKQRRKWPFFPRKHCALPTTLEMGKINN